MLPLPLTAFNHRCKGPSVSKCDVRKVWSLDSNIFQLNSNEENVAPCVQTLFPSGEASWNRSRCNGTSSCKAAAGDLPRAFESQMAQ